MVITTRGQLVEEVVFKTMTKKLINASDRETLAGRRPEYRRFLLNQSNASIRRTTGTQTPDPVLPVPTMLKPYNRNPLTIHIASHTGSEVRGEGNLMRRRSTRSGLIKRRQESFRTESSVPIRVAPSKLLFCKKRILGVYSELLLCPAGPRTSRLDSQPACCAYLMEIIFLCRGDSRVARDVRRFTNRPRSFPPSPPGRGD